MSAPTTLLVCAAPIGPDARFYSELLAAAHHVIAVDAGARLCLLNDRFPDLIVGDMDSLDSHSMSRLVSAGVPVERFPTRKDLSDLDLALASCDRAGLSNITVTACLGGRVDHTLATLGSLATYAHLHPVIREPDVTCWILDSAAGRSEVTVSRRETLFSVVALGRTARVSIAGAEYPLEEGNLEPLASLGLSNVVRDDTAHVTVHDGTVAVLLPRAVSSRPPDVS